MLVSPRNRVYLLALMLAVASLAAVALNVDMPVARYVGGNWSLGDLRKLLDISEVFAHGLGVLLILITVAVLDPASRRRLPRVGACVLATGVCTTGQAPGATDPPSRMWVCHQRLEHVLCRRRCGLCSSQ